ncbi:MAG TPA: diguanylate cyclase [Isosphaeraceae bacterium]|jgi:diguanylate cyclase (GGDEF)-like protein|nr:diguanylate cyclase [Isosphaeraceae bacterium]
MLRDQEKGNKTGPGAGPPGPWGRLRAWVQDRLEPGRRDDGAVLELAGLVASAADPTAVRDALVRLAARVAGARRVELFRPPAAGHSPRRLACWPESARAMAGRSDPALSTISDVKETTPPAEGPTPAGALRLPLELRGRSLGTLRVEPGDCPSPVLAQLRALCVLAAAAEAEGAGAGATSPPWCDPLTGQPDVAFLEAFLPLALAASRRRREPLSVLRVVVDRLDVIRDVQGPQLADAALRRATRTIVATLRAGDLVARVDEDGLAVVLPGAPAADARLVVAEAIRRGVIEAAVTSTYPLTVSIGVATFPEHAREPAALLVAAAAALELARSRGTDAIAQFGDEAPARLGPPSSPHFQCSDSARDDEPSTVELEEEPGGLAGGNTPAKTQLTKTV